MTTGIGKRRITPLLAAVFLSMAGIGAAQASSVDGTWIIRDLVLHIFDCEQSVCGRIVWLKDERRRSSQCGKTIIWGLEAKGPTDWAGGSILDPNNGKTYQLSATYEPDGTLHARIFRGVPLLGKTRNSEARRRTGFSRAVLSRRPTIQRTDTGRLRSDIVRRYCNAF